MLTVLLEVRNDDAEALGATLASLVPAAVDGLVREVVVLDGGMGPAAQKIADDAGCVIRPAQELADVVSDAKGDADTQVGEIQNFIARQVDAIIYIPAGATAATVPVKQARAAGIPVVTVDRRHTEDGLDCVLVDNVAGGKLAADHLAGNGFTRIACITGPLTTTTGADRLAGYRQALEGRGLPVLPELARVSDFTEDGGYTEMESLLGGRSRPDAVFVANNVMTVGALRAVADAGLRVPEDIAVVGFDDMTWSRLLRPPLTTVAQPTYDLGEETARLLLTRLRGYTGAPRQVVLSPTLRVRASSAARTPAPRSSGGDRAVRPAKGRPASPGGSRSNA